MKATAPLVASVAQVAQRWVATHMCSSQFSVEAVELCVAAAVSRTGSWSCAGKHPFAVLYMYCFVSCRDLCWCSPVEGEVMLVCQ